MTISFPSAVDFKARFRYHMLLTHVRLMQPALLELFLKAHKQCPYETEKLIEESRNRNWSGNAVSVARRLLASWGRKDA